LCKPPPDFVNPFEVATFVRSAGKLEFDVMLEAKMKDQGCFAYGVTWRAARRT
jgi:hypothetical protein